MEKHEYKVGPTPNKCAAQLGTDRHRFPCTLPASAEVHNLLSEEESQMVIGAIPLQALPRENGACPFCGAEAKDTFRKHWIHIAHTSTCFISLLAQQDMYIPRDSWLDAWNTRHNSQLIAELAGALRRMRTEFYAHDCVTNVDCRKCKALDDADAALASLTPAPTEFPVEHVGLGAERNTDAD